MNIIELDAVSKHYNGETALDNCSIEIEAGDRLVILGPSGCGKTTILRLIAGFIAPDTGRIYLNGALTSRDGRILIPPEKRNIGMVFQDLALWPHLTVSGNIGFGLKAKRIPKTEREAKIKDILQLVGLEGYAKRKPAELSGGQQQRVALARALVLQPNVLLMDEPLSNLDRELNVRLRDEVVRLQEQLGFTLLYVTHDREEAFHIARTVILMRDGRVEFKGRVEEAKRVIAGSLK